MADKAVKCAALGILLNSALLAAPRVALEEAVRTTLLADPDIQIQEEQVKFSRGTVMRESGTFDLGIDSTSSQGVIRTPRTELERLSLEGRTNLTETVADVTNQRLELTRRFRGGPSVSAGVELNRISDNLQSEPANRANVSFILNVPLLKLGSAFTAANEKAAQALKEAALLDLAFITGERVLNTATAYWECLGAEENLTTLREAAKSAQNLLERVKQLVMASEIPGSELRQTEADLAQKLADLRRGEQRFTQARQSFGLALGLNNAQLGDVPLPESAWPVMQTNQPAPSFSGTPLIERSLIRRSDYQAVRKNQEAAAILEKAARIDLRPRFDATFEAGYAGLSEGSGYRRYYAAIDPRPIDGPNALGALRFSYPIGNNTAKGTLTQREAVRRQTELREQNLARTIGSAIMVAFSDLEQSLQEVIRAREAVALYRQTVENEKNKLRIGVSTIVDVITVAGRLDSAQLRATDAQVRYATALTRLRFETGLLQWTQLDRGRISVEDLRRPPLQSELETSGFPQPTATSRSP